MSIVAFLLKFWCDNMKMNYLTLIKLLPFSDFFLSISDWLFNWYPIRYEGPLKLIKLIINVRWLSCEWFYTFEPLCFFKRLSFLVTPSVLCCYPLWLWKLEFSYIQRIIFIWCHHMSHRVFFQWWNWCLNPNDNCLLNTVVTYLLYHTFLAIHS